MDEADFNPYAAPVTQESGGAPNGMWQVSGSVLLFRDGARLPAVDVFTGRADVPLTPASSEFAVLTGWAASLVNWGVIPITILGVVFSRHWNLPFVSLLVGVVVLFRLLAIVFKPHSVSARLHWMVAGGSESRNRMLKRIRAGLTVFGVGAFGVSFLFETIDSLLVGFGVMVVSLLGVIAAGFWMRRLRCTAARDGWFTLKGIPSMGLHALARLQGESNRHLIETEPRTKLRKVFAFHGYRAPLRELLGMSWTNPMLVVIITFMKLTRSKKLVRDVFHWSEAEALKDESWDPLLRELQDEWLSGCDGAEWKLLGAKWSGSPVGDILTQSFTYVRSDGRTAMSGAVVRLATAHASNAITEVTIRSWRSDGTLRMTSNQRVPRPLPNGFDLTVIKGRALEVLVEHESRCENEDLISLGSHEEWMKRLSEEAEMRRSTLEEAGLYGPVREVEMAY